MEEFGWPLGMPVCRPSHGLVARIRQEIAENARARSRAGASAETGDREVKRKERIGSSFENFLKEEGLHATARETAIKRVLAWQLREAMTAQRITKSEMARRMKTSRAQLDRLLDPRNEKVLLETLRKAATAVGRELRVELR